MYSSCDRKKIVMQTVENDVLLHEKTWQPFLTPGIRILGTGSNTKNRVREVTTTFSGEYAIFILSDRQLY